MDTKDARGVPDDDRPDARRPVEAGGLAAEVGEIGGLLQIVRRRIGEVIFGQEVVVDQTLVSLLAGGHALLVGVPGLAKTRLVETLGVVLGLEARRIQCTPDLMPADILGSEVLEESGDGRRSFRFIPGPVFSQLLMADEVNRASPRTQSALLQAMQEHRVTVAGHGHELPRPFHVLATQNPLEQEGTYPLPEAQLDRFLLQVDVRYPDLEAERAMLLATTGAAPTEAQPVMTADQLLQAQLLVRRLPVGDSVVDAILGLVRSARPTHAIEAGAVGTGAVGTGAVEAGAVATGAGSSADAIAAQVAWGPGPRASQALMLACRARALLDGRMAPSIDDVVALAGPVLRHRMALTFAARADGMAVDHVIERLLTPYR